jgi:multidrug efflux pump
LDRAVSLLRKDHRQAIPRDAEVFALSLIFIFLILAALYESWSLPSSVLLIAALGSGWEVIAQ